MLRSIKHQSMNGLLPSTAKGGSPCMPVVSRPSTVCPKQGAGLLPARPVTTTRVSEVPLQSHEERERAMIIEPLDTLEWYRAADPQPRYTVVPASAPCSGRYSPSSSTASAGQATANNIVSIRTPTATTGVTALEHEIGLLKQKICNTKNLEQLRGARIQALQAAIISQGLNIPAAATAEAAASSLHKQSLQELMLSESLSGKHQALTHEHQLLMQKCRSQNMQIQALEAALTRAGAPLPKRSLASVSLSSYSPASSVSTTGTMGDEDLVLSTITFPAATQAPKPPRRHTVKCHFEVKCSTNPGEKVWIVGNAPALGSWDVDSGSALLLKHSDTDVWKGDLSIEWDEWDYYSPRIMAFKAVRQCIDGRMELQSGHNLEVLVGPSMGHHVQPCVASWEFDSYNSSDKPMNFEQACLATYHLNYDADVPEVVAKKKAQEDVEKCIQKLRESVLAAC